MYRTYFYKCKTASHIAIIATVTVLPLPLLMLFRCKIADILILKGLTTSSICKSASCKLCCSLESLYNQLPWALPQPPSN